MAGRPICCAPEFETTAWLTKQSTANLSGPTFPANREFKREILQIRPRYSVPAV
jgi:hypothetical protein